MSPSALAQMSFPLTAAGQFRFRTGFPFCQQRQLSLVPGLGAWPVGRRLRRSTDNATVTAVRADR